MEISEVTKKYWEEKDWIDLEKASSANDMREISKRVINRMPKPFVQVCGPIAHGGLGSIKDNLNEFNNVIKELQSKNINVFDQMPFEMPFQNLKKLIGNERCIKGILNEFYLPIFESGNLEKFYFIKDWESSSGACWEHEQAKRLNIPVEYL